MDQDLPQEEAGGENINIGACSTFAWSMLSFFSYIISLSHSRARIQEALAFASENFNTT